MNIDKEIKKLLDSDLSERQIIQTILDLNYNTKEKIKINGEVFTSFELIDEMMDKVPKEKWNDPNKIWCDPCAGLGNFHCVTLERLMVGLAEWEPDEEKRKKYIIENMLYFVELNSESFELIKKIFNRDGKYNMHIVCADFLDDCHNGWYDVGFDWFEDDEHKSEYRSLCRELKNEQNQSNSKQETIKLKIKEETEEIKEYHSIKCKDDLKELEIRLSDIKPEMLTTKDIIKNQTEKIKELEDKIKKLNASNKELSDFINKTNFDNSMNELNKEHPLNKKVLKKFVE